MLSEWVADLKFSILSLCFSDEILNMAFSGSDCQRCMMRRDLPISVKVGKMMHRQMFETCVGARFCAWFKEIFIGFSLRNNA